jgi:hypothetical protein
MSVAAGGFDHWEIGQPEFMLRLMPHIERVLKSRKVSLALERLARSILASLERIRVRVPRTRGIRY